MPLKDVIALWQKKDRNGKTMYSGQTQEDMFIPAGTWLNLFKNDKGDNPKRPDLRMTGDDEVIRFGAQDEQADAETEEDDDIPF